MRSMRRKARRCEMKASLRQLALILDAGRGEPVYRRALELELRIESLDLHSRLPGPFYLTPQAAYSYAAIFRNRKTATPMMTMV